MSHNNTMVSKLICNLHAYLQKNEVSFAVSLSSVLCVGKFRIHKAFISFIFCYLYFFFSSSGIKDDFVPGINRLRVCVHLTDEADGVTFVGGDIRRFRQETGCVWNYIQWVSFFIFCCRSYTGILTNLFLVWWVFYNFPKA